MATYYWVGGTGPWDLVSTANWSTTSGGASGAGPPTSADDVVFDANSDVGSNFDADIGTGTPGAVCKNLTFTAPDVVVRIDGSARNLYVYGDITFSATNVNWGSVYLYIAGGVTQNFTFNGETLNCARFRVINGSTLVIQDSAIFSAFTPIYVDEGTFDTNDQAVTISNSLLSTGALTRTIDLGSSTVDFTDTGDYLQFDGTNLTFNAGTSTINFTAFTQSILADGYTFYNVAFTNASAANDITIRGGNTFNDLTIRAGSSDGTSARVNFYGDQTINGTLSITSSTAKRRVWMRGLPDFANDADQAGTQRTLTVNAVSSFADIDFMDIEIAGTVAPVSGTRLGDGGNNSGITFDAPKTVYWNLSGTNRFWYDDGWATTSGGSPSSVNFPLIQDTMVIDDNSTMPSNNFYFGTVVSNWILTPSFDCSARTLACVISVVNPVRIPKGALSLSGNANVTYSTTGGSLIFYPTGGDITITTNGGKLLISNIQIFGSSSSKVILADDFEFSSYSTGPIFTLGGGILDLNGNNFYYRTMTGSTGNTELCTRQIITGTGGELICATASASGDYLWALASNTNFTVTGDFIIRYQGTKTSGTLGIFHNDGATPSATQCPSVFIETGSGFTFSWNLGSAVKDLSTQGYTGTGVFGGLRYVYGSLTIGTGHNPALSNSSIVFGGYDYGSGAQTITTNGKRINCDVDINLQSATGGVTLNGDLLLGNTVSSGEFRLLGSGTFDSNDYDIECWFLDGDGATAFTWNMGSGTVELTGTGTIWDTNPSTNITINGETSTILSSNTTNTSRVLNFGANVTIHNLTIGGGSSTAVVDLIYPTGLTLTGTFSSTRSGAAYEIEFYSGDTLTCADFIVSGSAGNLVTLSKTSTSNWSIVKSGGGIIDQVDYCNIEYSDASPASTWYAGANSVDVTSNSGWIFSAPPAPLGTGNFLQLFFP
jgi:hypothetical protein